MTILELKEMNKVKSDQTNGLKVSCPKMHIKSLLAMSQTFEQRSLLVVLL